MDLPAYTPPTCTPPTCLAAVSFSYVYWSGKKPCLKVRDQSVCSGLEQMEQQRIVADTLRFCLLCEGELAVLERNDVSSLPSVFSWSRHVMPNTIYALTK